MRNDFKIRNHLRGGGIAKRGLGQALKEGGKADIAQDKALIKKAIHMHDAQEHKGEHTDLSKLKKGGRVHYAKGTPADEICAPQCGTYDGSEICAPQSGPYDGSEICAPQQYEICAPQKGKSKSPKVIYDKDISDFGFKKGGMAKEKSKMKKGGRVKKKYGGKC